MKKQLSRELDLWRIDSDENGNPRYVIHYASVPYPEEYECKDTADFLWWQNAHIAHAVSALYGKRYRAKWFGGGVVFSTYNLKDTLRKAGIEIPDDLNGWM